MSYPPARFRGPAPQRVAPNARPPPRRPSTANSSVISERPTKVNMKRQNDDDDEGDDRELSYQVVSLTELVGIDNGLRRTVLILCCLGMVADSGTMYWPRVITNLIFVGVTAVCAVVCSLAAWNSSLFLRIFFVVVACFTAKAGIMSLMIWRAKTTIKQYGVLMYNGDSKGGARPWSMSPTSTHCASGCLISIAFIVPLVIVIIGLVVFALVRSGDSGYTEFQYLNTSNFKTSLGGEVWFWFVVVALVWSLPVLWMQFRLYAILMDCGSAEFCRLNEDIEENITQFGDFDHIYKFFLRHAKIALGVDRLSSKMGVFVAAVLVVNGASLMICEYSLIKEFSSLPAMEAIIGLSFVIVLLYHFVVVTMPASYLHVQAHAPLEPLHYSVIATDLWKDDSDERVHRVVNSFQNRLTTTKIGMNIGWSVISTSFALTLHLLSWNGSLIWIRPAKIEYSITKYTRIWDDRVVSVPLSAFYHAINKNVELDSVAVSEEFKEWILHEDRISAKIFGKNRFYFLEQQQQTILKSDSVCWVRTSSRRFSEFYQKGRRIPSENGAQYTAYYLCDHDCCALDCCTFSWLRLLFSILFMGVIVAFFYFFTRCLAKKRNKVVRKADARFSSAVVDEPQEPDAADTERTEPSLPHLDLPDTRRPRF